MLSLTGRELYKFGTKKKGKREESTKVQDKRKSQVSANAGFKVKIIAAE